MDGTGHRGGGQPRGVITWTHASGDKVTGTFIELVPDRRIVFTYGWERTDVGIRPGSTTVEITLRPRNGGTEVHLIHRGLSGPVADAHDQGWANYLSRLRDCTEGKDIGEDPLAMQRSPTAASLGQARVVAAEVSSPSLGSWPMVVHQVPPAPPGPRIPPDQTLEALLSEGETWGDSAEWLPALPSESVDLWFTSPPYANARAYSRIHPDRYVDWFLPYGKLMLEATKDTGWLVLNIKNRVAPAGPLRGQRHPYVYQLVIALQQQGWRWLETYIWCKPNAVPGKFGPRTKDSFEYVYAFAKGSKPYFDLDAIRVPYRTTPEEIERRRLDKLGRRNTDAGFGRDRTTTYLHGGADPGNVVSVPQTYNQHKGAGGHTAAMPEGLAEFFIKACSPEGGVVIDPFAGSGTTAVVARRMGRRGGGLEIHRGFVDAAHVRLRADEPDYTPVVIDRAR